MIQAPFLNIQRRTMAAETTMAATMTSSRAITPAPGFLTANSSWCSNMEIAMMPGEIPSKVPNNGSARSTGAAASVMNYWSRARIKHPLPPLLLSTAWLLGLPDSARKGPQRATIEPLTAPSASSEPPSCIIRVMPLFLD